MEGFTSSPVINTAVLVILGMLPSLIWLSFYIRKDSHPEPKHLISKVFLMGIIVSPIAILLQRGIIQMGSILNYSGLFLTGSMSFFLWAALVEEAIKFYAVKTIVLNSPEFDEPVDAMIYMITAALGFAAMENILVMFNVIPDGANAALSVWGLRFAGATLLHALSSAILGYFLAMSWFFQAHRKKLFIIGLIIATVFHFTFNVLLSSFDNKISGLVYATMLLALMALFVSILFDRARQRHAETETVVNLV